MAGGRSGFIGAKAHIERLRRMGTHETAFAVSKALFAAGEMIQRDAQVSITRGAVSGKNHRPSRPGTPPNNDTGVLANNIETVQVKQLVVEVSSNAPYATVHEFGDSKLPARPYLGPARDQNRKKAVELVRKAVLLSARRARSARRD